MSNHHGLRPLLNHICIAGGEVMGRFVGVHRDSMDSYYHLILRDRDVKPGRSRDIYMTMVTNCSSLAGIEHYNLLESEFTRDGCPPVGAFLETEDSRAQNITSYGHSAVDGGNGCDDRIVLSPEHHHIVTDGVNLRHQWLLVRRADFDDDTIVGLEEHDENGGTVLDAPEDGDWDALILDRIKAGMLRMRCG